MPFPWEENMASVVDQQTLDDAHDGVIVFPPGQYVVIAPLVMPGNVQLVALGGTRVNRVGGP